ncbi:MAG: LamG domain-containing protein, partial [Nanoarchaeota archaeon]
MEKERLIDYFRKYSSRGYSKSTLHAEALAQGWSAEAIDDAWNAATLKTTLAGGFAPWIMVMIIIVAAFFYVPQKTPTAKTIAPPIIPTPVEFPFVNGSVPAWIAPAVELLTPSSDVEKESPPLITPPPKVPAVVPLKELALPPEKPKVVFGGGSGGRPEPKPDTATETPTGPSFGILDATGPVAERVNITTFTPNRTTSVAGVWNYTDAANDTENGSTWTWFVNGSEAWRDAGLVSYWRMDGNGVDVLGRNNGTNNGASNTSGVIRSAFRFDGVDDFVNASNSSSLKPTELTLSAWVFIAAVQNSTKVIAGKRQTSGGHASYAFDYVKSPDRVAFAIGTATPAEFFVNTNATYGEWRHFAGTYNGTTMAFYINGQLVNTTTVNAAIGHSGTYQFLIGAYEGDSGLPNTLFHFNGSVDELKLFNRSLSASEVANEYQMMSYGSTEKDATGTPAPDIPLALWHFDDGTGATSAFDYFGDNNAFISNATRTVGVYGTNAFSFNQINASLIVSHSQTLNLTGNMTWMAWASTNKTGSLMGIVEKMFNSGSTVSFLTYIQSNNVIYCEIYNTTGSQISASASTMPTDGTLHHIACVHDNTNLSIYLDGALKGSITSGGAIRVGNNPLIIGGDSSYAGRYNGTIDEVEIYNRALTAAEINQSYRRSFPLFGLNTSRFGASDSLTFQLEPIQSDGIAGAAVNSSTLLVAGLPTASRVNITPFTPNSTTSVAGVWNYSMA